MLDLLNVFQNKTSMLLRFLYLIRFGLVTGHKTLFAAKDRRRSSDGKHNRQTAPPAFTSMQSTGFSQHVQYSAQNRKKRNIYSKNALGRPSSHGKSRDKSAEFFDSGILVRENTKTVKVDNTSSLSMLKCKKTISKTNSEGQLKNHRKKQNCHRTGSAENRHVDSDVSVCVSQNGGGKESSACALTLNSANNIPSLKKTGTLAPGTTTHWRGSTEHVHPKSRDRTPGRSDSIVSACSTASECQSTFSTSDITLNMQSGLSRENSFKRPKSAPGTFVRNASSGSLPNMIINNFIASSPDNFRSHGAWRYSVEYKGKWESMFVM